MEERLMPGNAARKQIGWIDLLRVLACFWVVLAHCCDPFVSCFNTDRTAFVTGSLFGSAMRPSVPLFAMMTGALLLPVRTGLTAFYRKRIGRIVWPLAFWSLVLPCCSLSISRMSVPIPATRLPRWTNIRTSGRCWPSGSLGC